MSELSELLKRNKLLRKQMENVNTCHFFPCELLHNDGYEAFSFHILVLQKSLIR